MKPYRPRLRPSAGYCFWCGREVRVVALAQGKLPPDAATRDHIYPKRQRSRMGYVEVRTKSRCVTACYACNNARGSMDFKEFRALTQDRRDVALAEKMLSAKCSAYNAQRLR